MALGSFRHWAPVTHAPDTVLGTGNGEQTDGAPLLRKETNRVLRAGKTVRGTPRRATADEGNLGQVTAAVCEL